MKQVHLNYRACYFYNENDIMFLAKTSPQESKMKYSALKSRRIASCLFLMVIAPVLLASCGGKEVKPVSAEARLAQDAFKLAETLKNAYQENDRSTLERNSTKDEYKELIGAVKVFDRAELTFTPTWVEIRDSSVYLTISWKGTWTVKGKSTEERGQAIFMFEGSPLKLAQIQRSSPFSQPE